MSLPLAEGRVLQDIGKGWLALPTADFQLLNITDKSGTCWMTYAVRPIRHHFYSPLSCGRGCS